MFSQQKVPKREEQGVFDVSASAPLPWDKTHPVQVERLTKYQTRRHTVYVGMYPREEVFSVLRKVFPGAADSYEDRPMGRSALLGSGVSDEGSLGSRERWCPSVGGKQAQPAQRRGEPR
jgi:hypothetical protein